MTRSAAPRAPRLVALVVTALFSCGALRAASSAFLPANKPLRGAQAMSAGAAVASLAVAQPAFAEEGLLNFGKVELGGGFALNLDIPETGIVNIAVLIGGLLYLLVPLLTESMASRNKEIQTDIDDAIAKYNEATARMAESDKAKAQAEAVIAEINASIDKDQREFLANIQNSTKQTLDRQAAAAEKLLKDLEANADNRVEAYVNSEAVRRGLEEIRNLDSAKKTKFLEDAIAKI